MFFHVGSIILYRLISVVDTLFVGLVKLGVFTLLVRELNMYKTIGRTTCKQEFDPKNLMGCWQKCMKTLHTLAGKKL